MAWAKHVIQEGWEEKHMWDYEELTSQSMTGCNYIAEFLISSLINFFSYNTYFKKHV